MGVDVVVEVVETGGARRARTEDVAGEMSVDIDVRTTEVTGGSSLKCCSAEHAYGQQSRDEQSLR